MLLLKLGQSRTIKRTRLPGIMASSTATACSASASTTKSCHRSYAACSQPPVVFVIGTTGTGKSELAIELAQKYNGEVINADVIQMYRGLEIASAKVTKEETRGIPHHMFSFLDPREEFSVRLFQTVAKDVIGQVHQREALPIVVGGTMYYTQSLLRPSTLGDEEPERDNFESSPVSVNTTTAGEVVLGGEPPEDQRTVTEVYEKLCEADPKMGEKLHPHDWRKISRSLEIYLRTGKPHSQHIIEQQQKVKRASHEYNSCILWVNCRTEVLDERLNKRIDKMIEKGLLNEIGHLHDGMKHERPVGNSEQHLEPSESTKEALGRIEHELAYKSSQPRSANAGLMQAIGYKEFIQYLDCKDSSDAQRLFHNSVDSLKTVTRQYSRQQIKWIRNRFIRRGVHPIKLDSSHPSEWHERVFKPACVTVDKVLEGQHPTPVSLSSTDDEILQQWKKKTCESCNVVCNGLKEWEHHVNSKRHKKQIQLKSRIARDFLAFVYSLKTKHGYSNNEAERFAQETHIFAEYTIKAAEDRAGFSLDEMAACYPNERKRLRPSG